MIRVAFNPASLNAQLDQLQARVADAVRPAAQAGAQVLYDEVRLNAPRSEKAHFTKGKAQSYQPGNLQRAIYQAYSTESSRDGKTAVYSISWNKSKAFYGRFVEFGTARMPAHSFLRRAYEAKKAEALQAAQSEFAQRLGGA